MPQKQISTVASVFSKTPAPCWPRRAGSGDLRREQCPRSGCVGGCRCDGRGQQRARHLRLGAAEHVRVRPARSPVPQHLERLPQRRHRHRRRERPEHKRVEYRVPLCIFEKGLWRRHAAGAGGCGCPAHRAIGLLPAPAQIAEAAAEQDAPDRAADDAGELGVAQRFTGAAPERRHVGVSFAHRVLDNHLGPVEQHVAVSVHRHVL